MLDGLPVPLYSLTAPTLLGITILLLLTGRIVPRSTLRDKSLEAEKWREAYEKERDARATSNAQTIELLETAKLTHKIVAAMFGTGGRRRAGVSDENSSP